MSLQDKLKNFMNQKTGEQLEAGKQFLEENAKKEGVTVLPSGLQYEVLNEGTGAKPGPTSRVTVHYEGRLIDGSVFDSSYKRNSPATFGVNQVIAGWTEAMQLMPQGSKWRLYIPSDLGYGSRGAGGSIPPNSALIFDVELLNVS
jgi:FKBP-type peptidyl-prolyl cis-trans isomerase FklB